MYANNKKKLYLQKNSYFDKKKNMNIYVMQFLIYFFFVIIKIKFKICLLWCRKCNNYF